MKGRKKDITKTLNYLDVTAPFLLFFSKTSKEYKFFSPEYMLFSPCAQKGRKNMLCYKSQKKYKFKEREEQNG